MISFSSYLKSVVLFVVVVWVGSPVYSQCINSDPWPDPISAPNVGITKLISMCNWAKEYAEIDYVTSATEYRVESDYPNDFITVRQGTPGGAVIAFGQTPLIWTSTVAGTYYVHFNADESCGFDSHCRITYITNLGSSATMTYDATTVTQFTANVERCSELHEIIGIEITTTGYTSPLHATSFRIRTDGSLGDVVSNVDNINIYYTGSSSTFVPTGLFGSAAPQTAGNNIDIVGNQTLATGVNYFWVAYGVNISANVGDVLDAQCTRIMVGGTNYSSPGNFAGAPSGNRTIIGCEYPVGIATNNTLWLKADDVGNIFYDGNGVSKWTSSEPGAISVSQSVNAKKPKYYGPSIEYNYNPHIKFDGVDDQIYNDNLGYLQPFLLQSDAGTVIIVTSPITGNEPDNETVFAYVGEYTPNYQIKPGYNCGYGYFYNGWQFKWDILPPVATPDVHPQILGFLAGETAFAFRNGNYGTEPLTTEDGAVVHYHLTLGSRGYEYEQTYEYSPAELAEVILYKRNLSSEELDKIQSYLALKYGITLGENGTAKNYYSAGGGTIWNASANSDYNYDIAGIGREDVGAFDQRKSHSVNGTTNSYNDILTVANGSNFDNPPSLPNNSSYLVWGHNNLPAQGNVADLPQTIEARFQRVWKGQETGTVGTVTLEFDMSQVPGPNETNGTNDLNEVRLLVSTDETFAGAMVVEPVYPVNQEGNLLKFVHDFTSATGFYFTLGSMSFSTAPLPIVLFDFTAECTGQFVDLRWTTWSEYNNDFFTVEKSYDGQNFSGVADIDAHGSGSSSIHYQWIDDSGDGGTVYYRLKETDFNGRSTYYDVVAVECGEAAVFRIYPNPTTDGVFIEFDKDSFSNLRIEIFNPIGELISAKRISGSSFIDLPRAKGVYILKVLDGRTVHVERIVKH